MADLKRGSYKWLALLTALLFLSLFYQLLFTPASMLGGFGVAGGDVHTIHLARRISALMLGFAVLLLLTFRLAPSKARAAIAAAVSATMAGFALNSIWGMADGLLGSNVVPAAVVECFAAVAFGFYAVADFLGSRKGSP